MKVASLDSLKSNLPKQSAVFASTCSCGICSGGSGNCKGCQDKNSDLAKVKSVYSK